MLPEYLTIQRRARAAFEALPEEERALVLAKFATLAKLSSEQWPEEGVRSVDDDEWPYLLHVTSSLRVFFSVENGRFIIQDFVRKETLDRFFAPRSAPAGRQ